jgi:hypothetical protein
MNDKQPETRCTNCGFDDPVGGVEKSRVKYKDGRTRYFCKLYQTLSREYQLNIVRKDIARLLDYYKYKLGEARHL